MVHPPGATHVLLVAIEYVGPDVPIDTGGRRRPLLEHAYDVESGLLPAHPRWAPRVAFPDPQRGWPTAPESTRCEACERAVTALIGELVEAVLHAMTGHTPWLGAPDMVPPPWLRLGVR